MAFEWLKSGLGKFTQPDFMNGVAKTMGMFAAKSPHRWYGDFLQSTVVPNAAYFGNLVRTTELLVGAVLVVAGFVWLKQRRMSFLMHTLLIVALAAGALLNLNFYLAAGFTSPSTEGINLVMGLTQLVLAGYYLIGYKATK